MALRHPLFVSGASGGVTSPQDARLALASLRARCPQPRLEPTNCLYY